MRDVLTEIEGWRAAGHAVALATVVRAWGSSPRPVGSTMAVAANGEIVGSVSGGCVEGAVVEEAGTVLASGEPKLLVYGVTDELAWSVGLSCGGRIEVFVERVGEHRGVYEALRDAIAGDRLLGLATVVRGPGVGRQMLLRPGGATEGSLGRESVDREVRAAAREVLASFHRSRLTCHTGEGPAEVFLDVHPPRRKLVVVGAVHAAIPLVHFANRLGYRTIVVDPRTAFATPERFGHADELLVEWPDRALAGLELDEATFVVALSHDLKLDLPALVAALAAPVRYVGALGSKATHAKRTAALAQAGVADDAIARIHAPIGLDLGGRRAEEIALSIVAEMQAVHYGRASGR